MNHNYLILIPMGLALLAFSLYWHGKHTERDIEIDIEATLLKRITEYNVAVDLREFRRSCPHAAHIVGAEAQPAEHEDQTLDEFIAGLDVRGL